MAKQRLIDANALLRDNEKYFCEPCKKDGHDYHGVACRACWVDDMRIGIENAPTVDAVPVVRCKDCKNFGRNFENDTFCSSCGGLSDPEEDDFCSYGERRTDNERKAD